MNLVGAPFGAMPACHGGRPRRALPLRRQDRRRGRVSGRGEDRREPRVRFEPRGAARRVSRDGARRHAPLRRRRARARRREGGRARGPRGTEGTRQEGRVGRGGGGLGGRDGRDGGTSRTGSDDPAVARTMKRWFGAKALAAATRRPVLTAAVTAAGAAAGRGRGRAHRVRRGGDREEHRASDGVGPGPGRRVRAAEVRGVGGRRGGVRGETGAGERDGFFGDECYIRGRPPDANVGMKSKLKQTHGGASKKRRPERRSRRRTVPFSSPSRPHPHEVRPVRRLELVPGDALLPEDLLEPPLRVGFLPPLLDRLPRAVRHARSSPRARPAPGSAPSAAPPRSRRATTSSRTSPRSRTARRPPPVARPRSASPTPRAPARAAARLSRRARVRRRRRRRAPLEEAPEPAAPRATPPPGLGGGVFRGRGRGRGSSPSPYTPGGVPSGDGTVVLRVPRRRRARGANGGFARRDKARLLRLLRGGARLLRLDPRRLRLRLRVAPRPRRLDPRRRAFSASACASSVAAYVRIPGPKCDSASAPSCSAPYSAANASRRSDPATGSIPAPRWSARGPTRVIKWSRAFTASASSPKTSSSAHGVSARSPRAATVPVATPAAGTSRVARGPAPYLAASPSGTRR